MGGLRRLLPVALLLGLASSPALASHLDPKKDFRAADQARARTVLLRRADLGPGFQVLPGTTRPSHNRCRAVDLTSLTLTGRAYSRAWTRGSTLISSSAELYESTADADAWWRIQTSAAGRRCAIQEAKRSFTSMVTLQELAFPRLAPKTILWRLRLGGTYFDILILQRERAHVFAAILSSTPPVRADELRLGRLLAGRLAKATRAS